MDYNGSIMKMLVLGTAVAFIVTWGASVLLIRFQRVLPWMDHPNARSSHRVPKPRSGGVAIAAALLLAAGCGKFWSGAVAGAAAGFFLLGLCDDWRPLPEVFRLAVQVALAWFAVHLEGREVGFIGLPWPPELSLHGEALAVFWIVGFVNIFNFMDGIDGYALGKVVMGGLALFWLGGAPNLMVTAAAAGGLLLLNFPPSRIFLGDGGSYLLGFLLAEACLVRLPSVPFIVVVMPFSSFLLDECLTLSRRLISGEKWYKAHRSHYYQRAVALGLTHLQVTLCDYCLTAAGALAAIIYLRATTLRERAAIMLGLCLALVLPIFAVGAAERHQAR